MPAAKAPKLTPEEQRERFIETAREVGASEDEAVFDEAIKQVAKAPVKPVDKPAKNKPESRH